MFRYASLAFAAIYAAYYVLKPYSLIKKGVSDIKKKDKILFATETALVVALLIFMMISEENKALLLAQIIILAVFSTAAVVNITVYFALAKSEKNAIFADAQREKEIRKFRHDIKNSLYGAKALVDAEEYKRASDYLGEMLDEASSLAKDKSYSDNLIANAVMKKLAAKCGEDIKFSAEIAVGDFLSGLSDKDVAVFFGNLADNAYEAALEVKNNEKFINFSSSVREKMYVIYCENSFDGKIEQDEGGKIITSKKDKKNHGFGLESVEKIISKIGGKIETGDCSDGIFRISAVFPRESGLK
ncbi:MAG: GHKL domain-containing protein [Clostridiales bacterium]|nr:GHKL domain-containing protein [Clostridiales bacterium]